MAEQTHAHIVLDHPVENRTENATVAEIRMRRAKVRDQRDAARAGTDDADREIRLFSNLCELPPEVIEDLDLADYRKLQEAFEGFL